jgi:hypothetical protein
VGAVQRDSADGEDDHGRNLDDRDDPVPAHSLFRVAVEAHADAAGRGVDAGEEQRHEAEQDDRDQTHQHEVVGRVVPEVRRRQEHADHGREPGRDHEKRGKRDERPRGRFVPASRVAKSHPAAGEHEVQQAEEEEEEHRESGVHKDALASRDTAVEFDVGQGRSGGHSSIIPTSGS